METLTMQLIVVLHQDDAKSLCEIFNNEGITTVCKTMGINDEMPITGIYIPEDELGRAIRLFHAISRKLKNTPKSNSNQKTEILIPVDLSPKSYSACQVGFELAERLNASPGLIHTYIVPRVELSIVGVKSNDEQQKSAKKAASTAQTRLDDFVKELQARQSNKQIPAVDFSTNLIEGVPEECILDKAKTLTPKLIVMATRTRHKRAEELIGSVTAEVLDLCRVPLFTVPENYVCPGIRNINRLVFFCHGDKHDQDAMQQFLAIFDFPEVYVTLLPVNDKSTPKGQRYVENLAKAFAEKYPMAKFDTLTLDRDNFKDEFKSYLEKENIELLIVQNKKKNIFSRLLNPGIAHILLYERDMPMIILPV